MSVAAATSRAAALFPICVGLRVILLSSHFVTRLLEQRRRHADEWALGADRLREGRRDADLFRHQAESEARGELARHDVLLGDVLRAEAMAGRSVHDIDHRGRIEAELL